MSYFAGIDVGSLSSDAAVIDQDGDLKGWSVTETGAHSTNASEAALDAALAMAGLGRDDLSFVVATGYGRAAVPWRARRSPRSPATPWGPIPCSRTWARSSTSAARIPR